MKSVRIESPEPPEGGYAIAQGTKVFSGDQEIHGIRSMDVHYGCDEIITASMELMLFPGDVFARACFLMDDPQTGERKEVSRIEFADGSVFQC